MIARLAQLLCLLLCLAGGGVAPWRAEAAPLTGSDLVRADLIAEPAAIRPGEPFWVAMRLRMKEHWHTYWQNPGDSGLPTQIVWSLPKGFVAGPIVWPVPERLAVGDLMNFGYEGETLLLTRITPPQDLGPGPVKLRADASWLVCERECIPGEAKLALDVPAATPGLSVGSNPATRAAFAEAREKLPQASASPARFEADPQRIRLRVEAKDIDPASLKAAFFFPLNENVIDNAAPQDLAVDAGGVTLSIKRAEPIGGPPPPIDKLDGVLVLEQAVGPVTLRPAFSLTATASSVAAPDAAAIRPGTRAPSATRKAAALPVPATDPLAGLTLLSAALAAFLGGVILNLMPCVFPVLSLKVLGLARQASESEARIRLHGLAYAAGILVAFSVLAGLLMLVRAGGAEIGWGFQLQSPVFVAILAYLLLAMGLSLSGAVQIGGRFAGIGDRLASRPGLSGSFFTGVLATLVATPCTAPFMGTAIGFALTQAPIVGVAVFLALGLGLACPFLLLSFVPGLHRHLPRPGRWMEVLKQFLAFPIYGTVAWLVWVLSQQVGPLGLLAGMVGLVVVGFAAWLVDLAPRIRSRPRRLVQLAFLAAIAGLGFILHDLSRAAAPEVDVQTIAAGRAGPLTEPFSEARLDALLAEGRPVFVNMTAAWCITCLVNERVALGTEAVQAAMAQKGIVYLKGDWTNQNPEITRVLAKFGRSGVPLYLLYDNRRGSMGEPQTLPQILTPGMVLNAIAGVEAAKAGRQAAIPGKAD